MDSLLAFLVVIPKWGGGTCYDFFVEGGGGSISHPKKIAQNYKKNLEVSENRYKV